ncbi:DNA polymerase III subunit delta' [Rhodobium gokarnense]|uniref:DNA polymerase-3 subunit delta n=1 Tax=Rhodobium gokarnense TaxID=364296 RepID=A0ABT3HAZ5_9HYPH|nr:DNA polymerase III subunit delta' [Rhodobium gokarnense]MCW2307572.1 DNA polymerase-3 subunit delta' [Rhodobium gokarnense]
MADAVPLDADAIDDVPHPRQQQRLAGQAHAETELLDAYRSGRIHHAWILSGTRGIGKATLAFRMARFVLAHPDPKAAAVAGARDLSVAPDVPAARKVAAGSHPDLLHLRRPYDDKRKRFKTELPVDEIRRTASLFGTTAGEGGWRICIVDAADDMNANAANALLKVLEEPPPRALFLVVSHNPGRLLPTIRSRCRKLALDPLAPETIAGELQALGLAGGLDERTLHRVAVLGSGSLRRSVLLLRADGVALWDAFEDIAHGLPKMDRAAIHALADRVAARDADDVFATFKDIVRDWLTARVRDGAAAGASAGDLIAWSEAWETINQANRTAAVLNLDRKQLVLDTFRTLAEAARNSLSPQST